jgi:uncharacterized protein (DUF427 family)
VRVRIGDKVIADTLRALALREADYPVVYYIPRADADMSLLTATSHATHCPYKGDASYFTITAEGRYAVNAVWSYQQPYPQWPRSRTVWRSIQTESMRLRSGEKKRRALTPSSRNARRRGLHLNASVAL